MIANMEDNKKLSPIVAELFPRGQKLIISFALMSESNLKVSKTTKMNATHYFIMKIPNKRKLQQVVSNQLVDIVIKDFMKLYTYM